MVEVDRLVRGKTKSEVHRRTEISLSHISRVLNGKRTPSIRKLRTLAAEYGVTLDQMDAYLDRQRKAASRKVKGTIA